MTNRFSLRIKRRFATAAVAAALGVATIASASAQGVLGGAINPGLLNGGAVLQQNPVTTRTVTIQGGGLLFLDAQQRDQYNLGYTVVVDTYAGNTATERWLLTDVGNGNYTIMQISSGQYLDAHEIASLNFAVITRNRQNFGNGDNGQYWHLISYGGGFYQIQQASTGRYLDLDGTTAVTRPLDNNNNQTWRITDTQ